MLQTQPRFLLWLFGVMVLLLVTPRVDAAAGKGAQALLQNAGQLQLTQTQRNEIQAIMRKTAAAFQRTRRAEQGTPGLAAKLDAIRAQGQAEALSLLNPSQRKRWDQLSSQPAPGGSQEPSPADLVAARSLIIPSIEEMKNHPSRNAFGPSTGITPTQPHPVSGKIYVILTDHTNAIALKALRTLANYREGRVMTLPSLGHLHQSPNEFKELQSTLRTLNPRYVAIAPRIESYRENMHLCLLKILAGLDEDPSLDAFPGYLMASNPAKLEALVQRTIQYRPIAPRDIHPVSVGAIEDTDDRRYRSYQKAKVMQKMFAAQGTESPAIIITTRQEHTQRNDFPKLNASEGNIAMLPTKERQTFSSLSPEAIAALNRNNVLFMFGHGTPGRVCGARPDAYADIDFSNELVFCGSCMSASPYAADRVDLTAQRETKRFAYFAVDNGAVMMFGHMGLCGGFPNIYPMGELVLSGLSTGEAYQRLMNALIGNGPFPDYYPEPAPKTSRRNDSANRLLYILWGDPALVAIKR